MWKKKLVRQMDVALSFSPGTPLASPPYNEAADLLLYMFVNPAAGIVSRKSTNSYEPLELRTSINPQPPSPEWYGAQLRRRR